jgi:hypothetical protein
LYVEVFIAFVAFATIVATIKQAFDNKLTVLQYLLFRFFVENGFLHVVLTLLTISLFDVLADKNEAWRYSTYAIIGVVFFLFHILFQTQAHNRLEDGVPNFQQNRNLGICVLYSFSNRHWNWTLLACITGHDPRIFIVGYREQYDCFRSIYRYIS